MWAAFTASNLGDGLNLVAMPLLAIHLTDDARLIAGVALFQYLPFLIIGLPAGVVLDRFDRRWLAVGAQTMRAAVLAGVTLLVLAERADIGTLMAASFLIGASEVMTDGGLPALVRELVTSDQLEVANARLIATQRVSNAFIGPPLGAVLFEFTNSSPFAVAAAMSLLSGVALLRLPGSYRPTRSEDAPAFLREAVVGVRYVWQHPVLRPLALAVATFSFVGAAGNAVFIVLATERFSLSGIGFGVLLSVAAVSSVTMTFVVAPFIRRTSHATSLRLAIVFFSVGSLIFGFTTMAVAAFVAGLISGASDPFWNIVSATVRQRLVPDEVFGRMMTAYLFIAWGMKPVGALLGGIVAEAWGAQWVSIGGAVVVGSMLILAAPMFRRVDESMANGPD